MIVLASDNVHLRQNSIVTSGVSRTEPVAKESLHVYVTYDGAEDRTGEIIASLLRNEKGVPAEKRTKQSRR